MEQIIIKATGSLDGTMQFQTYSNGMGKQQTLQESAGNSKNGVHRTTPSTPVKINKAVQKRTVITPGRLTSLIPPPNYGSVVNGAIYRSGFPAPENFSFLASLKLKTIITLVIPEEDVTDYAVFMDEQGIKNIQIPLPANKDIIKVDPASVMRVLGHVMDKASHPVLIHCNKGKHRTGCVVGCFRKCQGEAKSNIHAEYHNYADPKARALDKAFIDGFDERGILWMARMHGYAPVDSPRAASPALMLPSRSRPLSRSLSRV
ncbi:hypothetical protein K402DRAFT_408670 [Aulographum hederae CBS 113979]|uniref:Uncharacterized protein n=1 Tax=Aulographum hederae CBS 113979 TaxID=1176131 RepID=A0A6G1GJX2_9PEZI|nr:hypothetical protein K402DRAFT_408670 [Aulographum hederae CBS 113979]